MLSKLSQKTIYTLLIFLTLLTRFVNIFWGNSFLFHPDENNMGLAISSMQSDLNPHFFAYGQFPLYLAYFLIKLIGLNQNLNTSVYLLRILSALYSSLSVYVLFKISQFFFKSKQSIVFILLIIFCPGLIQLAHFGTTESLLILVFCLQIYLALNFLKSSHKFYFILSILVSAIGIASKISSFLLITPFLLAILLTSKKIFIFFANLLLYLVLSIFLSLILSPHNLINWPDFLSAQNYETSVATGNLKVFYTRQFNNTIPYFFQFTKIFPYVVGLPIFLLSFIFIFDLKKYINKKNRQKYLLILMPSLVYFLYFGQLFVKWTRFMSPLFFLFPFFVSHTLYKFSKKIRYIFIFISVLPGILFSVNYLKQDIRLSFSQWFIDNIPQNSILLSEAGNVINIPIFGNYQSTNFDFYNLDKDISLQTSLDQKIAQADFVIIPSRRILKNQFNQNYPYTYSYYQSLFDEKNFKLIKTFTSSPFNIISENAEETWTVFDRPVIRLYEKQK